MTACSEPRTQGNEITNLVLYAAHKDVSAKLAAPRFVIPAGHSSEHLRWGESGNLRVLYRRTAQRLARRLLGGWLGGLVGGRRGWRRGCYLDYSSDHHPAQLTDRYDLD